MDCQNKNLKVEKIKFTGWIAQKSLEGVVISTIKPKKGKWVEVMIELEPQGRNNGKK